MNKGIKQSSPAQDLEKTPKFQSDDDSDFLDDDSFENIEGEDLVIDKKAIKDFEQEFTETRKDFRAGKTKEFLRFVRTCDRNNQPIPLKSEVARTLAREYQLALKRL